MPASAITLRQMSSAAPAVANLEARLVAIASRSTWLMSALAAARKLDLASWCIGAGAVRALVWDALHCFPTPTPLSDVDLVYFDTSELSQERDAELQGRLAAMLPDLPWEVTNLKFLRAESKMPLLYQALILNIGLGLLPTV